MYYVDEWFLKHAPSPAAPASSRNLLKMQTLDPTLGLLNQRPQGWDQATWVLISSPDERGAPCNLRSADLHIDEEDI